MENQLFSSFENWDEVDITSLLFYQVVLGVQIGDNPIGTKFNSVLIDYGRARLELYKDDDSTPKEVYKLSLVIGERIYA